MLHAKRTENGLRHYNDQGLKQLQEILIYKQLGFSLKDIQQIINDTDNNILKSLIVNQRRKLKQEIKDASEQLASLSQLETFLNKHSDFPGNISQSIFDKIKKTKKLKQLRIKLLLIGISIDFILWGSILYFLFYQGNLIWLLLGILITVALTWYIAIKIITIILAIFVLIVFISLGCRLVNGFLPVILLIQDILPVTSVHKKIIVLKNIINKNDQGVQLLNLGHFFAFYSIGESKREKYCLNFRHFD